MDRAALQAAISLTNEQIAASERYIVQQLRLIEGLREKGQVATEAEKMLQGYEAALLLHLAHREQLSTQLNGGTQ